MGILRCPVCKNVMIENEHGMACLKNHRFDRASSGYVNLTIGSKQRKSGDEKAMIIARSEFLGKGHYRPLLDALIQRMKLLPFILGLDLGCGEGYYTQAIAEAFPESSWTGVDLSVDALKKAGKRSHNVRYLAASIRDLPIQDASIDLTLNIFAPLFLDEITRVMRPAGYAVFVLPNEDHLLELKEALYPVVRLNPTPAGSIEGFETIGVDDVSFVMNLSNQDLLHLLQMTPYVHKSPKESLDRLKTLASLHVRASFRILCVTKIVKKDA